MRPLASLLSLLALALAGEASGAWTGPAPIQKPASPCPEAQPATVDGSDGDLEVCVRSTPEAPASSVVLELTRKTWGPDGKAISITETVPIDAAPAGEIYVDGTRFVVTLPASYVGDGSAALQAIGPLGASSEVSSPAVRFRGLSAPGAPRLE